ncbi:DUF397 domain-containing protein [Pseudonocardia lacus]|uniref:DUF397 domain-containing protein n=1 Tax=Pseudonocardia lacus TaxID=2835865 RepID=UPI001BDBCC22|nr:DUF397 domain-containing protein [Pseudonocardia lacus]
MSAKVGVWRTSSFTNGNGGACVEVMDLRDGGALVRDTKDRTRPPLHCPAPAWRAFVHAIRTGEFE